MSDQSKKLAYFNTLIFTIIAAVVSLLLLAALFFDLFKNYTPFIYTVEIGIFAIIGYCIYCVYANEKQMEEYKRAQNFMIDFTQCPDYYVPRNINGATICSNEYIVEDQYKNKSIMKIYPVDDKTKNISYPFPSVHAQTYVHNANTLDDPFEKFDSITISSAADLPDNTKKCAAVNGLNNTYLKYSKIPWNGIAARCESYTG